MKVLVACEESQAVCKAFRELGHEAYSCDILPCSGGHPEWHIKCDVSEILGTQFRTITMDGEEHWIDKWDLIIAFPPCTDLAVSGAKHFERKKRDGSQERSIDFFMIFTKVNCDKVAIENPVGIMSSKYRKPDQIIQPYMFGDEAKKTTCLWLKGLPKLIPTKIVSEGEFYISPNGAKMPKWLSDPVDKNGKKLSYNSQEIKLLRSKTFPGIAKAMAEQWGSLTIITNDVKTNKKELMEVRMSEIEFECPYCGCKQFEEIEGITEYDNYKTECAYCNKSFVYWIVYSVNGFTDKLNEKEESKYE